MIQRIGGTDEEPHNPHSQVGFEEMELAVTLLTAAGTGFTEGPERLLATRCGLRFPMTPSRRSGELLTTSAQERWWAETFSREWACIPPLGK
jgi:hypothetical protein